MRVFLVLLFLCSATPLWAADLFSDGLGVHLADWRVNPGHSIESYPQEATDEDLAAMRRLGFSAVRAGTSWSYLEASPGTFRWSRIGDFVASAKRNGLTPILILGGGHPDYTGDADKPPQSDEEIRAFAFFAATVAAHYGPDVVWEIWNEPDLDFNWGGKADAEAYATIATAACLAIKKTVPAAKVIGPAIADVPSLLGEGKGVAQDLALAILRAQAGGCFDAFTIHPYRRSSFQSTPLPERVLADIAALRELIDRNTPQGRLKLPVAVSEWGFSTGDLSPEKQAAFVVRSQILTKAAGVAFSILYEWRDSFHGAGDPESSYGLLATDRAEKSSFALVRDVFPRLDAAKFVRRLSLGSDKDYLFLFRDASGRLFLACWSVAPRGQALVRAGERRALTDTPFLWDVEDEAASTISFARKGS